MPKLVTGLAALAAAAIAMSVPASADPISIAILGTVGIAATSTAVAVTTAVLTSTVSTALSVGLSFLSAALSTKPKPLSGTLSQVQFGGDVPRQIPMGEVKLGGQLVYYCGVGEKNKELHLVYALADWECESLTGVIVAGEKKTLAPDRRRRHRACPLQRCGVFGQVRGRVFSRHHEPDGRYRTGHGLGGALDRHWRLDLCPSRRRCVLFARQARL